MNNLNSKEILDILLSDKGLASLYALAAELGVDKQNIYSVYKGKCGISKNMAKIITSKYPDISPSWLRTGVGDMKVNAPIIQDSPNIKAAKDSEVNVGSKNKYAPIPSKDSPLKDSEAERELAKARLDVELLKQENEHLKAQLEEAKAMADRYWNMIENLMKK